MNTRNQEVRQSRQTRDDSVVHSVHEKAEVLLRAWDFVGEPDDYLSDSEHRAVDDARHETVATWY